MCPELVVPEINKKAYEEAGSKWVTFPPVRRVGDLQFRDVEIGMVDWDTPGKSIMFPVTVVEEGVDEGKKDKLSCGVTIDPETKKSGIFKLKDTAKALGKEDAIKFPGGKLSINGDAFAGLQAVGIWTWQEGKKGGVGEPVQYPKLTGLILNKPVTESLT